MQSARPAALRAVQRLPVLHARRPVSRPFSFFRGRAAPAKEPATKFRIRLQKPSAFGRRLLTGMAIGIPLGLYLNPVGFKVVHVPTDDEAVMKQKRVLKDDQIGGEDEEEDSGIFIPIWWPYEAETVYYKGTDPEWQEFRKLGRNPDKRMRIYARLAHRARHEISEDPQIKELIGEWTPGAKKEAHWIEIMYPSSPPEDYSLLGIHIDLPMISLAEQRLSYEDYMKFKSILFPLNAAKIFWVHHWAEMKVRARTFWEDVAGPPDEAREAQQHGGKAPPPEPAQAKDKDQPADGSLAARREAAPDAAHGDGATAAANNDDDRAADDAAGNKGGWSPFPRFVRNSEHMRHIKSTYKKVRQLENEFRIHRGDVILTGLVEMKCERGRVLIDVSASYGPVCNGFHYFNAELRAIREDHQLPKGEM